MWNYNKKQIIIVASAAVFIIMISLVTAQLQHSGKQNTPKEIPNPTQSNSDTITITDINEPESNIIYVHVAGKVNNPGVYELKPGSRVIDAIKKAGGAKPDADLESINLAEKLEDGEQVYIAAKGEVAKPAASTVVNSSSSFNNAPARPSSSTSGMSTGKSSGGIDKLRDPGDGKVNINTAGLEELQRLPGVGPSTAQKIIDYREANGRFNSIDELDEVSGIGPAKLEKMRPFIKL